MMESFGRFIDSVGGAFSSIFPFNRVISRKGRRDKLIATTAKVSVGKALNIYLPKIVMKLTTAKRLGALLVLSAFSSFGYAAEVAFPDRGEAKDHFFVSQGQARLSFEGEGRLSYLPPEDGKSGGTLLTLLGRAGSDAFSHAEKVAIDVRLSEGASFGIYVKASERRADSYLFLLRGQPEHRGALRAYKLPMLPLSGDMADRELKAAAFKGYDSAEWHRLELTLQEQGDIVVISARLLRENGSEVAQITVRDAEGALTGAGLVGLRFYAPAAATDGFEDAPHLLEVRRLTVEPELSY